MVYSVVPKGFNTVFFKKKLQYMNRKNGCACSEKNIYIINKIILKNENN